MQVANFITLEKNFKIKYCNSRYQKKKVFTFSKWKSSTVQGLRKPFLSIRCRFQSEDQKMVFPSTAFRNAAQGQFFKLKYFKFVPHALTSLSCLPYRTQQNYTYPSNPMPV